MQIKRKRKIIKMYTETKEKESKRNPQCPIYVSIRNHEYSSLGNNSLFLRNHNLDFLYGPLKVISNIPIRCWKSENRSSSNSHEFCLFSSCLRNCRNFDWRPLLQNENWTIALTLALITDRLESNSFIVQQFSKYKKVKKNTSFTDMSVQEGGRGQPPFP